MAAFNYVVFVLLPIFAVLFQGLLLAVLFFLKRRGWLRAQTFAVAGALAGLGFGYLYAVVSGSEAHLLAVIVGSGVFGLLSGLFWWYLLVKREADAAPGELR